MNERQSHLLRLLKEIDSFCREHDITYYCAAGTVLGAIRHGGFIPWDDDIDILMTRSEFCRFTEEFRKYGRKDRTIEFYEGDHEHHSTVARYLQEGTSMFCHYHITGYASAGILIKRRVSCEILRLCRSDRTYPVILQPSSGKILASDR